MLCPDEMLTFQTALEGFFQRNFNEEIRRLNLDVSSYATAARRQAHRQSIRSGRDVVRNSGAGGGSISSSVGGGGQGKRGSRSMALGRGGPSLYDASNHIAQLYGAGSPGVPPVPRMPHLGDAFGSGGGQASPYGGGESPGMAATPLQRNLAQLARHGIPGMSNGLLSSASSTGAGLGVQSVGNLAGTASVNGGGMLDTRRGSKSSPLLDNDSGVMKHSHSQSFSNGGSPAPTSGGGVGHNGNGGGYQNSLLSRNASSIGGRLSRFGSMLRKS